LNLLVPKNRAQGGKANFQEVLGVTRFDWSKARLPVSQNLAGDYADRQEWLPYNAQ
jgi:hypothetical protein